MVTLLQGFLGACNYYSSYFKDYAKLAGPMYAKLQLNKIDGKKGSKKPLVWKPNEIEAFHNLKKALTKELELFHVNPDKPFVLKTDASMYAIGAVLEQEVEEKLVPVGFF